MKFVPLIDIILILLTLSFLFHFVSNNYIIFGTPKQRSMNKHGESWQVNEDDSNHHQKFVETPKMGKESQRAGVRDKS